jgi:hypothetical protein
MKRRQDYAEKVIDILATAKQITDTADPVTILMSYNKKRVAQGVGDFPDRKDRERKEKGENVINMIEGLYTALTSLREIWISNPIEKECNEKFYRKQQKKAAERLDKWMQTGQVLFGGWKDGIPQHETVAFCAIIADLAGTPEQPLMMSLTIKDPKNDRTIVVE